MQLPLTVAGPLMMLGVLAVDSAFDIGVTDQDLKASYYTGFLSSTFPAVEAIIFVCFSTILHRLYGKDRTVFDVLTFVVLVVLVGIFVGILIPIQEAIASGGLSLAETASHLSRVAELHKVILVGLLGAIALQIKSFADSEGKLKKK